MIKIIITLFKKDFSKYINHITKIKILNIFKIQIKL